MLLNKICLGLCIGLLCHTQILKAQTPALDTLPLKTLQSFKPAGKSWSLTGNAYVNRGKKGSMKYSSGKGVLAAKPADGKVTQLQTAWNHADIDIEIEFMLSNKSAAALLLQGKYRISLSDSWESTNQSKADAGGLPPLTQNGTLIFAGIAPSQNAAKAPGTWQKLFVSFSAATFDSTGKQMSGTRINEMRLNNTLIHQNIDLPILSENSQEQNPLIFEASKGPVAFKNIAYVFKKYQPVLLKDIRYRYFEEKLSKIPDFDQLTEKKSGSLNAITWAPAPNQDGFAFHYSGKIIVPEATDYTFTLVSLGGSRLGVDGKTILDHLGTHDHDGRMSRDQKSTATLPLSKGEHNFSLAYYKNTWAPLPILGLFVQGKGNYIQALHEPGSLPDEEAVARIILQPSGEPLLQRGFFNFNGRKKMYCVVVGHPSKIHYAYDLSNGALLKAWKGNFVDATPMWHERGSQILELPAGGITFGDEAETAQLENIHSATWPGSGTENLIQLKGYTLNNQGEPEFEFAKGNMFIKDHIAPDNSGTTLNRLLRFNNPPPNSFYRLASGSKIEKMPDGTYAVNDKEYFIRINTGKLKPLVRKINNKTELVLPLSQAENEVSYTLIW